MILAWAKSLFNQQPTMDLSEEGCVSEKKFFAYVFTLILKPISCVGIVCIAAIWMIEFNSGHLTALDQYAYPLLIFTFSCSFVTLLYFPSQANAVASALVFSIASYFLASYHFIFIVLERSSLENNFYNLASISQWLPSIYIAIFLLHHIERAMFYSIAFYLALLGPEAYYIFAGSHHSDIAHNLLVNIVLSHPVYICILLCLSFMKKQGYASYVRAQDMERLVNIDDLTKAHNRRGIEEKIISLIENRQRAGEEFCLVMFDVDHFKKINDSYGHPVGDEVLVKLVEQTKRELRQDDSIGRWGGEEFILLLPRTNVEQASAFANRIRLLFPSIKFSAPVTLTASFGISSYRISDSSPAADKISAILIAKADQGLYQSKSSGRNQITVI
ncbi:GGDEF domain-containing protein [Psychrobium sp. 1_MG-2023]|uniref:GGDEF domain-containing protein n=1 Tax=Psychrobium sp. 1_MG-2023 TaxID=3062624 RepID=UPI000C342B5E|nr:GGDEF domain-containing protein [Psychrobium sp. 1_MG-2023]MDP2560143.1 GGDEF domain-containing protein [Psychrobium sp. 1_MG-2023]PKF56956.1 hypothetical protein CW748_07620 [Alteromonadales bacterium alter-6D02]